ncbi:Pre-mRNA-splicing factor cef1 [Coemansia sp. IMI 203386]|nr:Pre-mRNA-splicing factor cef1 [Coemansia sp. IMI 203386]
MRVHLKGGVWKNTEDEILKAAVMKYGKTQWSRISSLLVRKSPKQCKARWYEWLDPSIKKTGWSKEEDEKLLHLAKLMPTQWRTIAPIVGRAPAQCLERYQRLLDEAEARAAGDDDLGLRGEAGAEGRPSDARKLRPGEVDPNPETRPARPDPVDMDEDEKDMLSEARARLANTMGKKAKRKARERQLEEARRLAALQKRRELKAAGVELKPKKAKKGVKAHMDFNVEIPYERKPMPGFYDTTEELAREDRGNTAASLKGRFLDTLEAKSRVEREADARAEAKRKRENRQNVAFVRSSEQKGLDAIAAREEADQAAKRKRLVLPAPQVDDQELENIAKIGQQTVLARELVGGGATDSLLGEYSSVSSVGATRTPRTPAQANRIMNEALAQRVQAQQATPLLGAKAQETSPPTREIAGPGTGFASSLPQGSADMATPNPLASTLGSSTNKRGCVVTVRDELGLNTPGQQGLADATPRERKAAGRSLREQLAHKLAALPKPKNEFEIVVPDAQPSEIEDAEESRKDQGSSATIEDQADVERQMELLRLQEVERSLHRRTQCVQRGLPRPDVLSASVVAVADDPAVGRIISNEMRRLILHDSQQYPVAGKPILRAPSDMHIEEPEEISDEQLAQARALVAAEISDAGIEYAEIEEDAWRKAENAEIWIGQESRYVRADEVTGEQLVGKYKTELGARRELMTQEAAKAAKIEKKLAVTLGGYQARSKMFNDKISAAYKEYEQTDLDTRAFAALYASEQAIIPARIQKAQDELRAVEVLERSLQAEYQELVERKNALVG